MTPLVEVRQSASQKERVPRKRVMGHTPRELYLDATGWMRDENGKLSRQMVIIVVFLIGYVPVIESDMGWPFAVLGLGILFALAVVKLFSQIPVQELLMSGSAGLKAKIAARVKDIEDVARAKLGLPSGTIIETTTTEEVP